MIRIENAASLKLISVARELFVEYSQSLEVDLCFQDFARELETLPGQYAAPAGRLLLAWAGQQAVGCGALRPLGEANCEMKRLYVRPAFRGEGTGRALVEVLIEAARNIGHRRLRLDTLPSMSEAIALYRSLGFKQIAPYRPNPVPGALFLELDLSKAFGAVSLRTQPDR